MDPCFETIQADDNSSFRIKHFTCRRFADDHTWHYHSEFELTWIIRSAGTRFVGDSIESYQPNDLVFVGPNLPHCWHNQPGATESDVAELIVVQFGRESLGTDFLKLPETVHINRLFDLAARGLHVRGRAASLATALMQNTLANKGLKRLLCLLDILNTLADSAELTPLASADYQMHNDVNETNRQRIEFIHRYVREHLNREITQSEVAQRIGLTPSAFSRFFRNATGQTFVGFVNILRINEVCRRLMDGDTSITDIAMSCGYNNIANFNRQFLSLKGMNPSRFRDHRRQLQEHRIPVVNSSAQSPPQAGFAGLSRRLTSGRAN
jgi:AraC-like DNA-binding protein